MTPMNQPYLRCGPFHRTMLIGSLAPLFLSRSATLSLLDFGSAVHGIISMFLKHSIRFTNKNWWLRNFYSVFPVLKRVFSCLNNFFCQTGGFPNCLTIAINNGLVLGKTLPENQDDFQLSTVWVSTFNPKVSILHPFPQMFIRFCCRVPTCKACIPAVASHRSSLEGSRKLAASGAPCWQIFQSHWPMEHFGLDIILCLGWRVKGRGTNMEPTWNQRSHVLTMSYWTQGIKYWRPNNHEPSTSNSECRRFCTVNGCNMLKLFTSLLGISPQTTGLLPTAQIQNSIKKWPNMTSSCPPQKLIAMIHRELLGATLWKSF